MGKNNPIAGIGEELPCAAARTFVLRSSGSLFEQDGFALHRPSTWA
jgi:hypothetical protein